MKLQRAALLALTALPACKTVDTIKTPQTQESITNQLLDTAITKTGPLHPTTKAICQQIGGKINEATCILDPVTKKNAPPALQTINLVTTTSSTSCIAQPSVQIDKNRVVTRARLTVACTEDTRCETPQRTHATAYSETTQDSQGWLIPSRMSDLWLQDCSEQ